MSRRTGKNRRTQQRQTTRWLILGGVIVVGLAVGAWWLTSRNPTASGTPQPISRLTTRDFHSLAFSPTDPETVFFGHHGGLLVSRNGGRDWQTTSLQNADAMALAVPPSNPQIMYAAGHDVFFKSTDGGASWQAVLTNLPGTDIHGFAVDPEDADRVFAHVVGFGIFGSADGGVMWTRLWADAPPSSFNLAVGNDAQMLYVAAGQAGLWRSQDGGQTWSPLTNMPGDGAVAVTFDRARGRLCVSTLGNQAGLYVSDDDGTTWTALGLKGTLLAVAVSPHDPQRLIAVDEKGQVFASPDGGLTWPGN